jgi:DNA-binding SARP family transcriptional activator/tRNA A-37 threonylcarbamoyl transferase component Bud32
MEFGVLGKLEVTRDGRAIDLGAFRQRALLGLLLTSPNSVFATDQILEGLWGEEGGTDKQSSLWVYVSGLRTALEPNRAKRSEGTVLLTRAPGYVLDVAPEQVDAGRFERLVAEGRALADIDPAAASTVLSEALALWRGRAFEEFMYESFAQGERTRLEAMRMVAVEARIDADLKRGMSRELVPELEGLVRQHPLHENLAGQLMTALYRSGRQADALRTYRQLKSSLGEQLGVEPSNHLRHVHDQIVLGDEALDGRVQPSTSTAPGLVVRGYELRQRLGERGHGVVYRAYQPTVGREVAIKVIRPELANDPTFIRRFQAQAQLVARLEHPHIVPLYDYWREPDAAYLVMRLMKGGTLGRVLEDRRLDADEVIDLADQIGAALQMAHRAGLVHGDIQPENVLLDADGYAYLSDFGITSAEQTDRVDVTASSDIRDLAMLVAQALTGSCGSIDEIRGALPPPVRRVIDEAMLADHSDRRADVAAFVGDLHEAMGSVTSDPMGALGDSDLALVNPYKGLRSFGSADAADFHGRHRLVERLLARLDTPGTSGRFIALVGPSGSGKSSVVSAGLLPAIRRGTVPSSGSWYTIEMTPAPDPFERLERALVGVAVDPPASLLELLTDECGLQRAVSRVLPAGESQLILVIDQFEELFVQVDADLAGRFIEAVVNAVMDDRGRIRVIVTLRADFYDRPLRHRRLGELLRDGTEVITPMTPEEIERAVVGPVEPLGVTFEPALVAELVHDVVDRAGALPLLQFTLTELFDARHGRRITATSYHELGGVSGSLVKRAEGLFTGLGTAARDLTRLVLLRLVTMGEGTVDTRRRVMRSELEQLDVDRQQLDGVLALFGRHRLLGFDRDPVTRGPTVEISHEALLMEWARLREWIDSARLDVRAQRRLAEAMREWEASGRSSDFLLRGGRLEQVRGWATTSSFPLSQPEQAFLGASVAEHQRAEDDEREREQRASDAELRERRRRHQLVAVGVTAAVIAAVAALGAVQWRSAEDARVRAERAGAESERARSTAEFLRDQVELDREWQRRWIDSSLLVDESDDALARDEPELAVLLAVQAIRETADPDGWMPAAGIEALHLALQGMNVRYDVTENTPVTVLSGPDGPAGVYVIPPAVLVEFAEAQVGRRLTEAECEPFYDGPCPLPAPIPVYAIAEGYTGSPQGGRSLEGTTVRIADEPMWREPVFARRLDAFTATTGIQVEYIVPSGDQRSPLDVDLSDGVVQAITDRPEVRAFLDFIGSAAPT